MCTIVVERAKIMVEDWQLANVSRTVAPEYQQHVQQPHGGVHSVEAIVIAGNTTPAAPVYWHRPLQGRYKCNIDVAFSTSHNRTEIGLCVWDS